MRVRVASCECFEYELRMDKVLLSYFNLIFFFSLFSHFSLHCRLSQSSATVKSTTKQKKRRRKNQRTKSFSFIWSQFAPFSREHTAKSRFMIMCRYVWPSDWMEEKRTACIYHISIYVARNARDSRASLNSLTAKFATAALKSAKTNHQQPEGQMHTRRTIEALGADMHTRKSAERKRNNEEKNKWNSCVHTKW